MAPGGRRVEVVVVLVVEVVVGCGCAGDHQGGGGGQTWAETVPRKTQERSTGLTMVILTKIHRECLSVALPTLGWRDYTESSVPTTWMGAARSNISFQYPILFRCGKQTINLALGSEGRSSSYFSRTRVPARVDINPRADKRVPAHIHHFASTMLIYPQELSP